MQTDMQEEKHGKRSQLSQTNYFLFSAYLSTCRTYVDSPCHKASLVCVNLHCRDRYFLWSKVIDSILFWLPASFTRKGNQCQFCQLWNSLNHYNDVILSAMASQITSLMTVYSSVYSADQRKQQSSASLAFVGGIHRWPVNSPHKWMASYAVNVSIWWRHHVFGNNFVNNVFTVFLDVGISRPSTVTIPISWSMQVFSVPRPSAATMLILWSDVAWASWSLKT